MSIWRDRRDKIMKCKLCEWEWWEPVGELLFETVPVRCVNCGEPEWFLPGPGPGCALYVLALDDGAVKVGRTSRPLARLREHDRTALRYGRRFVDSWVTDRTRCAQAAEMRMLGSIKRDVGATERGGTEWFVGVTFTEAVLIAQIAIEAAEYSA